MTPFAISSRACDALSVTLFVFGVAENLPPKSEIFLESLRLPD